MQYKPKTIYTVSPKLLAVILSNLNRCFKKIFTVRFSRKFAIKRFIRDPTTLSYIATLPCENIWYQKVPCSRNEWNNLAWFKLSCVIQPFKNGRWKSFFFVWRCEHYLINWQKYNHSVHTTQPTEWSIIRICVINVTPFAFANDRQCAIHLLACNFAECSAI